MYNMETRIDLLDLAIIYTFTSIYGEMVGYLCLRLGYSSQSLSQYTLSLHEISGNIFEFIYN